MHVLLISLYWGGGYAPSPDPTPSFFEVEVYYRNITFYYANQYVPRRHKNK